MVVFIRAVKKSDFADIANLIKDEREHLFVFPAAKFPMTVAQVEERASNKREFVYMAKENIMIGFANLYDEKGHVFIGNLAIAPAHRGKGYAKKMIAHMIELAREKHQLQEIRISLVIDNKAALALYTSLGFEPYSLEVFKAANDTFVNFLHMKKSLV